MTSAEAALAPVFEGRPRDVTEENLQARIRGLLLMALSNKFGSMLLTTGNKSEMSVGYATLYGDMCGGFSVLKDIYKTEVYRLSRWRNANRPPLAKGPLGEVIPERTLTRPPTAELRPNQTDQDSLPPYDQLDAILKGLIEEEKSVDEIAAAVAPREIVAARAADAVHRRIQAPPGASGREGEPPQLRARSPLSDHQPLPGDSRAPIIARMKIILNGDPHEVAGPLTLTALLAQLNIDPRRVAVEHNLTVVKRANYDSTQIQDGDQIEIVNFVGGGSLNSDPLVIAGREFASRLIVGNRQVLVVPGDAARPRGVRRRHGDGGRPPREHQRSQRRNRSSTTSIRRRSRCCRIPPAAIRPTMRFGRRGSGAKRDCRTG